MIGTAGEVDLETLELIQAVAGLGSVAGAVIICWILTTARMKERTEQDQNRLQFQDFLKSLSVDISKTNDKVANSVEVSSNRVVDALMEHSKSVNTCKLMQDQVIKVLERTQA